MSFYVSKAYKSTHKITKWSIFIFISLSIYRVNALVLYFRYPVFPCPFLRSINLLPCLPCYQFFTLSLQVWKTAALFLWLLKLAAYRCRAAFIMHRGRVAARRKIFWRWRKAGRRWCLPKAALKTTARVTPRRAILKPLWAALTLWVYPIWGANFMRSRRRNMQLCKAASRILYRYRG